ncbi:hypothetical protein OC846_002588 [Tilletia horrida]|uniref:DNA damage-binding protein 1 n=1 Tax=Tilletia horrida TaxID=155126 RepID=A0AAN6GTR7_9BASI|nr:hypothetical protein OC845_002859 [Tilletia horrida]KAK0553216.1 hypothetical protein OC846_002588 [Tilletia horrida]KAK0565300.1 hypothetical protein OC861_003847 [Tilletia horrida]
MLYLSSIHPASARSATLRVLPDTLAFVGHSTIDLLSLPNEDDAETSQDRLEPFSNIGTLPFNARILQASALPSLTGGMLVLTDHPAPRLVILAPAESASPQGQLWPHSASYRTHSTLQLQDTVRPPAELGIGFCVDTFGSFEDDHTSIVFSHTYSGSARIIPLKAQELAQASATQSSIGALAGFDVKLPHPTLIQSTFLDTRHSERGPLPPLIALLSLSSIPTTLPGLGPQCLPVLSFHWIDEEKRELTPCPWGPSPTPGPPPSPKGPSKAQAAPELPESPAGLRRSGRISASSASGSKSQTYGPSAKGADRSPAALIARDKKLAESGVARAHVPIPYIDALGVHFMLALPARAGGGVLLFSENCIMHVPPPPSAASGLDASASDPVDDLMSGAESQNSSPAKGKRRKGSDNDVDSFASKSSTSPLEASSTVNEHGKRRRASGSQFKQPRAIIKKSFRKPMQVVAAIVQSESSQDGVKLTSSDERTAAVRVIFASQGGVLYSLVISLTASDVEVQSGTRYYTPVSMQTSKIGPVPRPGSGSGGLLYLGDGFLQVACMVGDSALVRIDPDFVKSGADRRQEDHEDDTMDEDENASSTSTGGVQEYKRFPNIAPIVDFVVESGGETASTFDDLAARIVTCSGTGPSGTLRSVRTGAELLERGTLKLNSGLAPANVFHLAFPGDTRLVLLTYPDSTDAFLQTAGDGHLVWEDISPTSGPTGIGSSTTLAAITLALTERVFLLVSPSSVRLLALEERSIVVRSEWKSPSQTTLAAVDPSGRVLLANGSRTITHLRASAESGINVIATVDVEDEVSSLSLQTLEDEDAAPITVAAVGLFVKRSIRLLNVPDLKDITPELLSLQTFSSLPSSALLHSLKSEAGNAGSRTTYLFIGLAEGAVVTFKLDQLGSDDAMGSEFELPRLTISDRRLVTLGSTPIRAIVPLRTTQNVDSVLMVGDRAVLMYVSNGLLNSSALSYGSLSSATAALPIGSTASEVLLVRSSNTDGAHGTTGERTLNSSLQEGASLHILQIGAVKKIDIETLPLGVDNPLAITLDSSTGTRAFGVVTWRYVAEGDGAGVDSKGKAKRNKGARGKVILISQDTFETIDTLDLEAGEHPHCIENVILNGRSFFVVGTGWDNPMESETLSGRLIGLELVPSRWENGDREISVVFSQKVRGGVNAIVGAQGHLIAAINSQVVLYQTQPSTSVDRELSLQRKGAWACAFFATTLVAPAADPGQILVGDAMRSMVILKLDAEKGRLSEAARECDPSWTSAVEQLSATEQKYIGADVSFNIFMSARTMSSPAIRRRKDAAKSIVTDLDGNEREPGPGERSSNTEPSHEDNFTHVMKRRAAFHLGDLVNRFRKGALHHQEGVDVMGETVIPNMVFCTAAGALGLIADISQRSGALLGTLAQVMDEELPPLGRISMREWRAFRSDHRELGAHGFVDGDLLDRFLALSAEQRAHIYEQWKLEVGALLDGQSEMGGADEIVEDHLMDTLAGLAQLR